MTTTENLLSSPADEHHLACLLLSPAGRIYLTDTLDAINPDDFHDLGIGMLWSAARIIHASGQRITKRALLTSQIHLHNEPGRQAGPKLSLNTSPIRTKLEQLTGEPIYPDKIPTSIRNIRETAKMRRLTQTLTDIQTRIITAHDYSEAMGTTHDALTKLEETDLPLEAVPFSTLTDEFHKTLTTGHNTGETVPTPWPELDDLLSGGFHPGRSYIFAGRPGAGKTICGLNAAQTAAEQGYPALIISEEMSNFEVTGRLLAAGAHVEYSEITRNNLSSYTTHAIDEYINTNKDMPLWVIDKPGLTIEYIAALARTLKRRHGLTMLVVDYLQLLEATDRTKVREQQVAHISRSIKQLSRELDCVVIVLAQLNRDNVKTNRRPTLADLRESGSIEQDADTVILLHHETTDEGDPTGMVTFIVGKNRHGRQGNVELRWRAHQARIG